MLPAGSRASTSSDLHVPRVELDLRFTSLWKHGNRHSGRVHSPAFFILRLALPAVAAGFVLERGLCILSRGSEQEEAGAFV